MHAKCHVRRRVTHRTNDVHERCSKSIVERNTNHEFEHICNYTSVSHGFILVYDILQRHIGGVLCNAVSEDQSRKRPENSDPRVGG